MTNRIILMGLVSAAGLALAACQSPYTTNPNDPGISAPSPNFPVRQDGALATQAAPQASNPVNPPAPGYEDAPISQQSAPITSQTLPPVASAPQQPVYAPPPPPPPPEMVTETRRIITGQVVDAEGPAESYTVKSGDTLYSISKRMDMTVAQMADVNNLKEPYTLRPGQKLKGKRGKSKAYVVQSGDTLSAIGRRFSVSTSQLAQANDTDAGATIRPGQKLTLPQGYRDQGPQTITVTVPRNPQSSTVVASAPPPAPRSVTPTQPPRPQTPPPAPVAAAPPPAPRPSIIPTAPPSTATDIVSAGRGKFIWPISGRQLTAFGARGGNQVSNGLNIAAASGTSVKAAAPGQVIYAGDEVQGFGNLVLVEHENGFVSVYAHLSKALVAMRQQVSQGQPIGEVGQSGGVSEPQLYFEMRHRPTARDPHKPFDPTLVLPSR